METRAMDHGKRCECADMGCMPHKGSSQCANHVIAYVADGEVYCPDCWGDTNEDEGSAVLGEEESSFIGSTCGGCHACFVEQGEYSGEWEPHEDAVGKGVRWAECHKCNGMRPVREPSRHMRRDALTGKLQCPNCHGAMHF